MTRDVYKETMRAGMRAAYRKMLVSSILFLFICLLVFGTGRLLLAVLVWAAVVGAVALLMFAVSRRHSGTRARLEASLVALREAQARDAAKSAEEASDDPAGPWEQGYGNPRGPRP